MNAEYTLTQLKNWCSTQSGNEQIWSNKGTKYCWNRGRDTNDGIVNGVVRKLAGVDSSGEHIWTVAGSFKINQHGTILRFTGIPRKSQKLLEPAHIAVPVNKSLDTVLSEN